MPPPAIERLANPQVHYPWHRRKLCVGTPGATKIYAACRMDNAPTLRHPCQSNHRGRSMSDVQQDIFEIIAKQAKIELDTIKPESTLKDLGIASLDAIEVIFDIEEHFNINLPNDDVDFEKGTVGHLISAVERQLADKPAS
jgi:acyl carrier protein